MKNNLDNTLETAIAMAMNTGFRDNACLGGQLLRNAPSASRKSEDKDYYKYEVSEEWASLYQTWSLAQIAAHMDDLDILLPQLLIPQVLDSSSDKYLFNRAISSWMTANFYILKKDRHSEEAIKDKKLGQLWGEVNKKFVSKYPLKKNNSPLSKQKNIGSILNAN